MTELILDEFVTEYPSLNLKLKEEAKQIYDLYLIGVYIAEYGKGFRVKKVYKTNKKGTKVRYKAILSKEEVDETIEEIKMLINEYQNNYDIHPKISCKE